MNWNGIQVFGNSFHPYCMDIMHMHSRNFKSDYLISILDVQVMEVSLAIQHKMGGVVSGRPCHNPARRF